jgi:hypothetical protein
VFEIRGPDCEHIKREQDAAGLARFRKYKHRSADNFDDASRENDFAWEWHPTRRNEHERVGRTEVQDSAAREKCSEDYS